MVRFLAPVASSPNDSLRTNRFPVGSPRKRGIMSGYGIWSQGAPVLVDGHGPADRRKSPLRAVRSLANLAPRPDRHRRRWVGEIEAARVDESARMANVATEADGKGLVGFAIARVGGAHRARDPHIGSAIRRLRDLGPHLPDCAKASSTFRSEHDRTRFIPSRKESSRRLTASFISGPVGFHHFLPVDFIGRPKPRLSTATAGSPG